MSLNALMLLFCGALGVVLGAFVMRRYQPALAGATPAAHSGSARRLHSSLSQLPLLSRPVLNTIERSVWLQLVHAFPECMITIKMPVTRFTIPRPGEDARELFEMLHGLYCTFAVCSSEGRVLGCVDVVGPSGMTTANSNFKHELLEQCSIAYCVLEPGAALPPAEELRQRFLGEGESSASDLVKLQQARKQLHRTLDQNRHFRNEGSAGAAWQQVDSFLAPMDSRSGTIRS